MLHLIISRIRKYKWTVLWSFLVITLSLLPGGSLPKSQFSVPYLDKMVHFGFYFMLIIFYRTESGKEISKQRMLPGLCFSLFLATATEYGQRYFAINRSFEFLDMAANWSGVFIGLLAYDFILKKL